MRSWEKEKAGGEGWKRGVSGWEEQGRRTTEQRNQLLHRDGASHMEEMFFFSGLPAGLLLWLQKVLKTASHVLVSPKRFKYY